MRLVTGMGTAVDGQGAALDERLAARFVVASVGAFIGMYSVMALEIGFSVETLWERIAISLWWCVGTLTSTAEVGILARIAYLWATLMPFALKGARSHVSDRGSTFDNGILLRGWLVHHIGG